MPEPDQWPAIKFVARDKSAETEPFVNASFRLLLAVIDTKKWCTFLASCGFLLCYSISNNALLRRQLKDDTEIGERSPFKRIV
jgi:hypothetical protein